MHNPMDLSGRCILVTGASSGIGRGTAILLSRLGARVVLSGRDEGRLQGTLGHMEGDGHVVEMFDLAANVETIPQWMKSVTARTGPLHGLVHSAGVSRVFPIQSVNLSRINDLVTINLTTSLMLAKAFRQKGCFAPEGSSIVLLSSIAAVIGQPALSIYSATKAGLIGATRSLALEFARERIRVNCIAPGAVQTEMWADFEKIIDRSRAEEIEASHPLGVGTVEDVANGAAFLLANTGRWITGTVLMMDGGCTAA